MMNDASPKPRGRGRPATPPETHRRSVNIRLHPALLKRLQAAAAKAGHSLSSEIQARCQAYEGLRVVHEEKVAGNEEWWLLKLDRAAGDLSVVRLPSPAAVDKGDQP
jgi:hypothetical protein